MITERLIDCNNFLGNYPGRIDLPVIPAKHHLVTCIGRHTIHSHARFFLRHGTVCRMHWSRLNLREHLAAARRIRPMALMPCSSYRSFRSFHTITLSDWPLVSSERKAKLIPSLQWLKDALTFRDFGRRSRPSLRQCQTYGAPQSDHA